MRTGRRNQFLTRTLLPILIACIGLSASLNTAIARDVGDKRFSDWNTTVVRGQPEIYLLYTGETGGQNVLLQMGKRQGDCGNTLFTVLVRFPKPAPEDFAGKDLPGEVQVSGGPIHKTVSRFDSSRGNKFGVYLIQGFENPGSLLQELASGQSLRVRFMVDGKTYDFSFSLNGFRPAYDHVRQWCDQGRQPAGEGADEETQPRPKRRGPAQQAKPPANDSIILRDPPSPGSFGPGSRTIN